MGSRIDLESSDNSELKKKFKLFNFPEPSLASLAIFFITLLFTSSLFYSNSETAVKSIDFRRWMRITNGSSSLSLLMVSSRPSVCENGLVGFLDEGGGECDIFDGNWVWDERYPLYKSTDCHFIDADLRCSEHGRPNNFYTKWRWQPKDCNLPRFDGGIMLEKLRNKRVVFAGDSIARNQWESFLCMLSTVVSNKSSIYEVNGNAITKRKGYLIFKFDDFNCTVEYFKTPFLVAQGRPPPGSPAEVRFSLRVDQMPFVSSMWRDADLLILNSGHWWTYGKILRGGIYFQKGNNLQMNMSVEAAYQKSIETMVDWVNTQVDTNKTHVFFRTYSPNHFSGGSWDTGGGCHREMLPDLGPLVVQYSHFKLVMDVLSQRPNKLEVLSVTNMTMRRKDGHPSIYKIRRENEKLNHQDCSHWCLPGVPDSWNELIYALFLKQDLTKP